MCVVTQVAKALQMVLTSEAQQLAVRCGVIRRRRKLDGARLIQGLVLGWMQHPQATLEQLAHMTAACGTALTPQAVDQRFSPELAECLRQLLERTVAHTISTQGAAVELLNRFAGVYLLDSTVVALPDPLRTIWPSCGGDAGKAALKLQVRLELSGGQLQGPVTLAGRTSEQRGALAAADLPAGSLWLADLAYFNLAKLRQYSAAGVNWLVRLPCGTVVCDAHGQRLDLPRLLRRQSEPIEMAVQVGIQQRLPCRLLAWPVSPAQVRRRRRQARRVAAKHGYQVSAQRLVWCRYDVALTNLPTARLSQLEARVLLRARWQIEMLFKLWKSYGRVGESRSEKPWRILAEVYAKLMGLVIQHWLLLVSHWDHPHRSWFRAIRLLQDHALLIAYQLHSCRQLMALCRRLRACLTASARTEVRNKSPSTYQLLANPRLAGTLT